MHEGAHRTDQGQSHLKKLFLKKTLFEVTKPLPAFTNMNQLFIEKAGKRSLKSVTYPRATEETNIKKLTTELIVEEPEAKH